MSGCGFRRGCIRAAFVWLLVALGGCANLEAWERGALARPDMAWEPDPLMSVYRRHIEYSKEAASGGATIGGGGCGCN